MTHRRTAIVVSPAPWPTVPAAVTDGLDALHETMRVIVVGSPDAGDRFETRAADLRRPLELALGDWDDVEKEGLVFIAVGPEADVGTITRSTPVVYVDLDGGDSASRQALMTRAGAIIGSTALAEHAGARPTSIVRIDQLTAAVFVELVNAAPPPPDRSALHRCLAAETFNREELALVERSALTMLSAYGRDRVHDRLGVSRHRGPGDAHGELALAIAEGASRLPSAERLSGVYRLIAAVYRHLGPDQLLSDTSLLHLDEADPTTQRIFLRRALSLLTDQVHLTEPALQRLIHLLETVDVVDALEPDHVSAAARLDPAPSELLERVRDRGRAGAALAARYELARISLEAGGWIEPDEFDEMIAEIDDASWHPPLFQAGLAYWTELVGTSWMLDGPDAMPPIRAIGHPAPLESIAELEAEAKEALGAGAHSRAIDLFEQVRLAAFEHQNPPVTTEIAARLNIGWARWDAGEPQSNWLPYLSSALADVQPPDDLVRLRQRIRSTRDASALLPDRDQRVARELLKRIESGAIDPAVVIEDIDRLAVRRRVWLTGLAHFRAVTGDEWTTEYHVSRRDNSLLTVWRGGWRRVDRLYVRQLHRARRLVTADRLLRLQVARAKAAVGLPSTWWGPSFTKALRENGPPAHLVPVRAEAHRRGGRL